MASDWTALVAFLKARLDEDERFAAGAYGSSWDTDTEDDERSWVITEDMHLCEAEHASAWHIARHDPARVLRDVEAKRRIIAECIPSRVGGPALELSDALGATVLAFLALPYADHPDYQERWKP